MKNKLFSNEIVFRGHPDKVCDQISDAILDQCLCQDRVSRCGVEVVGGKNAIFITGEITTGAKIDIQGIARRVLRDVGYRDDYRIIVDIGMQSQDISLGTSASAGGAGDNGMMFGYATNETEKMLPKAMCILQDLSRAYDELRKVDNRLLPDGKAQITGEYDQAFRLQKIKTLTLCYQNTEDQREQTDDILVSLVENILLGYGIQIPDNILINPTGRFCIGGFDGDAGLTGRKIVVDSYHGFAPVGGGAFSGKDPTKVDRSGAYKARQIAKDMLRLHDLAWCEVQLSYSIGIKEPMAIYITSDKGDIDAPEKLYQECIPSRIIKDLGLLDMQYEGSQHSGILQTDAPLTQRQEEELLTMILQQEREAVIPKLDCFRQPMRIKLTKSGRGTGKSWSISSLLIQMAHRTPLRIGCFREIQKTLQESSYALMRQTITRLGYSGWKITDESIESACGSRIIFRGLKDIRAAGQVKGLEAFDIFWLEEAATISHDSLRMLLPTLRKPGSELWASWNPETDNDPIDERLWNSTRDDAFRIWLNPGVEDNPYWGPELQKEMEEDYKRDPDEAEHTWGGQPRKQGQRAVMSRAAIRQAMDRELYPEGVIQIGCDVARFGDDRTELYKRKGLVTIDHKEFVKQDTMKTAYECWDMAGRDPSVPIIIDDTGVGGGVSDRLRELGAKVVAVNFGSSPTDKDKFTSVADELWFNFPIDEVDIPDDRVLMAELSGRQYDYDSKGRRKIEPKDVYKKRCGKSPDRADALLLTYYQGGGMAFPDDIRDAMRQRRVI